MPTHESKDRSHLQSGEVLDFQPHRIHAITPIQAELSGIPTRLYIRLIRLAQRAEQIWCDETAAVRREAVGLLDIRDRSGAQVSLVAENLSLLDLDRDFVASRLAGLAAKEALQERGATELDAEAILTWDDIEATISFVKHWDAFIDVVRAYGRSTATEK
ncbi:hypothetical protein [Bradyrhizobium sp. MOS002]|uniref:hypothetical protein n=1 Tax=Bradyrhizobium sp. MOS002 TaxID=2133947 RepID=UPI000D13CFD0|nr:hypothetical protein [Bradyrhizobium sp. MOS002]PSO19954.1 hypothetical protein C7G41_34940 [Bradyrhizobium sp. MOS002]